MLYDDIGNLISDGTQILTWTIDGLLESVTANDVNINFTYDALNRRVEKRVYINDMLNKTTEYIYDNWQVIEERSGANVKSFVYGDYIDEVIYFENSGVGYYPLRGANYNIEALTNSSGDLVETYAIDVFGNFKVFDAAGVEKFMSDRLNSILFQGREYDDDVGLYYFRNRWYSAEIGRFISRDPLRYGAGDVNLYRFEKNNAYNSLDWDGLLKRDANGKLIVTRKGTPVKVGHGGSPGVEWEVQPVLLYADDGTSIDAFSNLSMDQRMTTDCHGVTFSEGEFWVNNDMVEKILLGDGYKRVSNPQIGDVVVFHDGAGNAEHSVTIIGFDKQTNEPIVQGLGGLEVAVHQEPVSQSWVHSNYTVWRRY